MCAVQGSSVAAKTLCVARRGTIAAKDEPLFASSNMVPLQLALHADCLTGVEVATDAEVDWRWPAGGRRGASACASLVRASLYQAIQA